ncbi:hypothetical protein D9M70_427670 [compost metagenome]
MLARRAGQIACGFVQGWDNGRITVGRQALYYAIGIVANRVAVCAQATGSEFDAENDAVACSAIP